jgi:hypothetical protein
MTIEKDAYMPILKWRMGEYQALLRLRDDVKDAIVPLIVIPPVEYDFDEQRPKKTLEEHISPFAERYRTKWGDRKSLIDIDSSLENQNMTSGKGALLHIFDEIRSNKGNAIPVISLRNGAEHKKSVKIISKKDKKGFALRLRVEDLIDKNSNNDIETLLNYLDCEMEQVDFIVDLVAPQAFEPYQGFGKALMSIIKRIEGLNRYRSFVVAGTSLSMNTVKQPCADVSRHEWLFYKHLYSSYKNEARIPTFGDYTIEQPGFVNLDMRLIKSSGKIVYTTKDNWHIQKGGAFRDNPSQMRKHCSNLIKSACYEGASYSAGDLRIEQTAKGEENYGNLTTWKWVGVNHHITKVVEQLASFHDS